MKNRTSIPADLKRRILVEAGHRCTIATCLKKERLIVIHAVEYKRSLQKRFPNIKLKSKNSLKSPNHTLKDVAYPEIFYDAKFS